MSTSVPVETAADPLTLVYKHVNDHPILIDVYPPPVGHTSTDAARFQKLPAVIYFHGGALTVGNRKSWFPDWLYRRVVSLGMVFISADYQLIPPATGHDILGDIKDLFRFLERDVNQRIQEVNSSAVFAIDSNALAVAGSSAGGMCAYLAAMHASPRPKVVLSLYGMGGDMLTWQYLSLKTTRFFRGREILDPKDFPDFLHPTSRNLSVTSDSPLAYHPQTYHIPGYPANPRMLLGRLYLQLGNFLDYFSGSHEPSLSTLLRDALSAEGYLTLDAEPRSVDLIARLLALIPAEHRVLFPQFNVTSSLPPMLFIHGSADTAVLAQESRHLHKLVQHAGVRAELRVIEGKEHSFDYEPNAEKEFGSPGGLFDEIVAFLEEHLLRYANDSLNQCQ